MQTSLAERHSNTAGGFTLVEVMVALAIVSMVVFTLLLNAGAASRDAHVASRYRTARLLAEELMGEVVLGMKGNEVGRETGNFERDQEEWSFEDVFWELTVDEFEWEIEVPNDDPYATPDLGAEDEEPEPLQFRQVRLRVWFEGFEGDEEGEIKIETYLPWAGEPPELQPR